MSRQRRRTFTMSTPSDLNSLSRLERCDELTYRSCGSSWRIEACVGLAAAGFVVIGMSASVSSSATSSRRAELSRTSCLIGEPPPESVGSLSGFQVRFDSALEGPRRSERGGRPFLAGPRPWPPRTIEPSSAPVVALGWAAGPAGMVFGMTIGTSILLIAVGAILKYAVTAHVSGIDLQTVGVILMLVGILGLILSLLYTFVWSDRARARDPRYDERTRNLP